MGRTLGEGLIVGMSDMRPAGAAEMVRLADMQVLTTVGVRTPLTVSTGASRAASAAAANGATGGIGTLVNIEGDYVTAASVSPQATALVTEARIRGLGG